MTNCSLGYIPIVAVANIHEQESQGQTQGIRRRDVLKFGLVLFADIVALDTMFAVSQPYLIKAWDWIKQQRHRMDIVWAQEVPCLAKTETIYSADALQRTYAIASGDSIGEGYYQKGKPDIPAAEYATDAINGSELLPQKTHIQPNWDHLTIAREGSRIQDVQRQLRDPKLTRVLQTEANVDWWLSVGGNDIVHALASKASRLKRIANNPFTPDFFTLDDELLGAIAQYQVGFLKLLRQIAAMNNGNVNRLVIEGLPNLGNADRIDYVSRDGKVVESYPLKNERLGKYFATNLAILINNAMKESINQLLTENPGMDILFLDTFHMLPPNQLLGEHPLPQGQRTMAANFFGMAFHAGQNLAKLIYPNFEKHQAETATARRTAHEPWVIQLQAA